VSSRSQLRNVEKLEPSRCRFRHRVFDVFVEQPLEEHRTHKENRLVAVVSHSERRGAAAAVDTRKLSAALWIVQGLLALVFLFTGLMKLTAPSEMLAALPLPIAFVRFLGLAETLGAIGMILPGLLRMRTGLTPLAASGLTLIMMGATVLTPTLLGMDLIMALPNVVLGALAATIAYSRWQLAPLDRR
jgi:hypothetical protein